MMKFQCTNKRCKHENKFDFKEDNHYPLCPCCNSPMLNIEQTIKGEMYRSMLKNINYYGIRGTYNLIDRLFPNALQRIKYRQLLEQTIKKYNLKEKTK